MRRTTIAALALIILALSVHQLQAQDRGTGLGVILGEPTGISLKHWLGRSTAIDVALAWSLNSEDIHFQMTYLFHAFDWIKSNDSFGSRLNAYYGIGGRVRADKRSRAGARGVMGLVYFVKGAPMDVFVEFAPVMDVAPGTELDFNAGLGIRYFF